MSLKAVHLVFVNALSALAVGCAIWKFRDFAASRAAGDLFLGIGAVAAAILVVVYGWYFLKKMKSVSYM